MGHIPIGMAGCLLSYVRHKTTTYDHLVFYEDLVDDFDAEAEAMFRVCGMKPDGGESVRLARAALDTHSQGDVFRTARHAGDVVTAAEWEECDALMARFGVPVNSKSTVQELKEYLAGATN